MSSDIAVVVGLDFRLSDPGKGTVADEKTDQLVGVVPQALGTGIDGDLNTVEFIKGVPEQTARRVRGRSSLLDKPTSLANEGEKQPLFPVWIEEGLHAESDGIVGLDPQDLPLGLDEVGRDIGRQIHLWWLLFYWGAETTGGQ